MSKSAFSSVPQPRAYPFVGNAPSIDIDAPIQSMMRLAEELGPVYRLQFPSQTALVVGEYRLVEELSDASRFEKIVHAPLRQLRDLGGDALFTADNDDPAWAIAHRMLMPAFGAPAMRRYWADMVDVTDQLVMKWERLGPQVDHDVADNMTRLTLDTIALSGFSYRFNSYYQREMHPFVDSMVRALGEAGARSRRLALQSRLMLVTRRQYERDLALMYDVVDEVIRERKSQPKPEGAPKDLLDLMLADGALSDVQIRFQIMTFLIAGHETTSGLLSFTLYQLLRHPDAMAKAVAEVDRVLGSDHGRVPQFEDLAQLRYLDHALKESLRLWPTAPAFGLTAKQDTLLGGEIEVRPSDVVLVLTPLLHRDPAVWRDPEVFDPDRWDHAESIPANAWKPFGTGQRACIGRVFAMQEATLVLAALLWRFELSDPYGYQLRIKESLTLKPENLLVRAKKRTPAAGHVAAAPKAEAPKLDAPVVAAAAHATPLLVLFGSNSGSAQDFAERLARDAARRGYAATVAPLDEHAGHLPREGAVVIVTASYNGQPPDNARRFCDWLDTIEPGALTGVRYTVLGCGHRDWASTYQAVPRRIEARLAHAGARALHARGEADAGGDFFGAFETWSQEALASVDGELGIVHAPAADVPCYQIERVDNGAATIAAAYNARPMTITSNRELIAAGDPRSKRHLEIALPAGVTYRAGDYLAVLPENEPDLVRRAAVRFQLAPDDTIVVHRTRETSSLLPVDRPITVAQLLARFVELKAPATRSDIKALAAATPCPPEAMRLLALAESHETEVLAKRVSVLDLLERFQSTQLPFARFLELLPPMKPRRYSIASSPLAGADRCALAVAVLDAPAWSGTGRYRGTCSTHLARLEPGAACYGSVVSPNTPFFLPDDPATPVIFIGAGTGIAPFRGFLEERAALHARGTTLGTADLFFGCDHPDVDFLYRDELAAWETQGIVTVRPAFFRQERDGITFVQHRLWHDREHVAALLDGGARIYVCGDGKRMAPAVRETLATIHADHTGVTVEAGRAWLAELEATGRYTADVFAG